MKRILLSIAAAAVALGAPASASAQALEGRWTNPKRNVIVNVARCGRRLLRHRQLGVRKDQDKVAQKRPEADRHPDPQRPPPCRRRRLQGHGFEPKRNIRGSATVRRSAEHDGREGLRGDGRALQGAALDARQLSSDRVRVESRPPARPPEARPSRRPNSGRSEARRISRILAWTACSLALVLSGAWKSIACGSGHQLDRDHARGVARDLGRLARRDRRHRDMVFLARRRSGSNRCSPGRRATCSR